MTYYAVVTSNNTLMHYGAKGMHWGQRKYQNEDGSLTEAGKIRYGVGEKKGFSGTLRTQNRLSQDSQDQAASDYRAFKDRKADIKRQYKNKEITRADKKYELKKNKETLQEANERNSRNYDIALNKSTKRGRLIAQGVLGISGGMALAAASGVAQANGNATASLLAQIGAGVLGGIGAAGIVNAQAHKRAERY